VCGRSIDHRPNKTVGERGLAIPKSLVAYMRKLLTILNAMIRSNTIWQEDAMETKCPAVLDIRLALVSQLNI